MATPEAVALARRQKELSDSLSALEDYKSRNEEALRQALRKDEAVKKHTNNTSKEAIKVPRAHPIESVPLCAASTPRPAPKSPKISLPCASQRERVEWLQRIVDEESTKPLQVPTTYVQSSTKAATDYSRRIANDNARRSHTLNKISAAAQDKASRRRREAEFHRRWNSTVGKGDHSIHSDDGNAEADLDEISQLAAQVRVQAERHSVDGSLPLDEGNLGLDMMDELSLTSAEEHAPSRSTVFRKKRTESTLNAPAQTYYTVKQTLSDGDISMGQSSEMSLGGSHSGSFGDSGKVAAGRRKGSSRLGRSQSDFSLGLGDTLSSLNSTLPRDHIEKLERQRASIRKQREMSRQHASESRAKLAEQERRSNHVVREWLKKQRDVDKQKNRAIRRRIVKDQKFIEGCQSVIQHCRTPGNGLPPLEMMHASDTLAKKKKEDGRARAEGRPVTSGDTDDGADGEDGLGGEEVAKSVLDRKVSISVIKMPNRRTSQGKTLTSAASNESGAETGTAAADAEEEDNGFGPKPPVELITIPQAPPGPNPIRDSMAFGDLTRPSSQAGMRPSAAEVDSHMLLDEETEFQLSRLEAQQDDLEDWSRSLQHQVTAN